MYLQITFAELYAVTEICISNFFYAHHICSFPELNQQKKHRFCANIQFSQSRKFVHSTTTFVYFQLKSYLNHSMCTHVRVCSKKKLGKTRLFACLPKQQVAVVCVFMRCDGRSRRKCCDKRFVLIGRF